MCPASPARTADPASATHPRQVRVHFTGNRVGLLRPCGCAGDEGSGVDAERTLVLSTLLDPVPLVRVDSGAFVTTEPTDLARLRSAFLLQGLALLDLDAINVTAGDLEIGVEILREASRRYSLPLISANLHPLDSDDLLFPASRVVEARDSGGNLVARIGVVGVTAAVTPDYPPSYIPRTGLPGYPGPILPPPRPGNAYPRPYRTSSPRQALEREASRLQPECDFIIALTWFAPEGARNLVEGIPGVSLVVAGSEPVLVLDAGTVGETRIVTPGYKGNAVGEVLFRIGEDRAVEAAGAASHFLASGWRADPDITALVQAQDKAETLSDLRPEDRAGTGVRQGEFAGAFTCRDCHFDTHGDWDASAHAQATQPLYLAHEVRNPLCLSCHSTGFGQAGGFRSLSTTPGLQGVQCESCHTPASGHVAWGYRDWRLRFRDKPDEPPRERLPFVGLPPVRAAQCARCHDTTTAPAFSLWFSRGAKSTEGRRFSHDLSRFE